MKLYKIRNTKDGAIAYLSSPYNYQAGEVIYPHPDAHPSLQGHECNRWRIITKFTPIKEENKQ